MRIENIRTKPLTINYDAAFQNTNTTWRKKNYLFVQIETDTGLTGLGEIYVDGTSSVQVAQALIEDEIAPAILGHRADNIGSVISEIRRQTRFSGRPDGFGPSIAGVDIALWDLLGKSTGLPIYKLLGGYTNAVQAYASGGMFGADITPKTLAREFGSAMEAGHCGAKIKAFGPNGIDEDFERAEEVRNAIGKNGKLMIDAMFSPTLKQAMSLARGYKDLDLHFLEAPTSVHDILGWKRISQETGVFLAGPELESCRDFMHSMLLSDSIQYLQFDIVLAGGITAGRDLSATAHAHHKPITLHCAASAVGIAASAHLLAAIPNADTLELHVLHKGLRDKLWDAGWNLADGNLIIPDQPGLGLQFTIDDIDTAKSERNAVAFV